MILRRLFNLSGHQCLQWIDLWSLQKRNSNIEALTSCTSDCNHIYKVFIEVIGVKRGHSMGLVVQRVRWLYRRRRLGYRHRHTKGRSWEDKERDLQWVFPHRSQKEPILPRLLASRAVRRYISVVEAPPFVALRSSSPGKLIQGPRLWKGKDNNSTYPLTWLCRFHEWSIESA